MEDENNRLVAMLKAHLARIEEQLGSAMKKAAALPEDRQNPWWELARDLQKEARVTRKQIASALEGAENRGEERESNCEEGEGSDTVISYGIHH